MSLLKSGELLAKKYDYKIPEICTDLLRPIIEELDTEDLEWFEPKMRKLLDEGVIDFYYIVYNRYEKPNQNCGVCKEICV